MLGYVGLCSAMVGRVRHWEMLLQIARRLVMGRRWGAVLFESAIADC